MTRKYLKIGIFILFILLILIVGLMILRRINHNRGVIEQDLYKYIPSEVTTFYQINKSKDFNSLISFFEPIREITSNLGTDISYPLIIMDYDSDYVLVLKATGEQENLVKNVLSKKLFNSFPPKIRAYRGIDIFSYFSVDETFFSCIFHNGVFIGGYNSLLIEKVIDHIFSENKEKNDLPSNFISQIKSNYPINIYSKDQDQIYILNGIFKSDGNLDFTGYTCEKEKANESFCPFETERDSILIDSSILNDSILSYSICYRNKFIADNFAAFFDSVAYQIKISPTTMNLSLLKCNEDRFEIFEKLNDIEKKYTSGRKLNMQDIVLNKQHIYTASNGLSKTVFLNDQSVIFTFYKGYLVLSNNRDDLIKYLTLRETNIPYKSNSKYADLKNYDQIFFSKNIEATPDIPLRSVWKIFDSSFSSIEIFYSFESSQCYEISFLLNNPWCINI